MVPASILRAPREGTCKRSAHLQDSNASEHTDFRIVDWQSTVLVTGEGLAPLRTQPLSEDKPCWSCLSSARGVKLG